MKNNEIPLLPESTYHIYNHANGKENLFQNDGNYRFFLARYAFFIEPIAETYAYCLMPNHLHLMVKIKNEQHLQSANRYFQKVKNIAEPNIKPIEDNKYSEFVSRTFGNLFSSYTQAYNKQQKRIGSLFIPNFKRKAVENDSYFTKLLYYIHFNPVHHGFVKNIEDWNYSSFNSLISEKKTKLSKEEVLAWFGDKNRFLEFHRSEKIDLSFDI